MRHDGVYGSRCSVQNIISQIGQKSESWKVLLLSLLLICFSTLAKALYFSVFPLIPKLYGAGSFLMMYCTLQSVLWSWLSLNAASVEIAVTKGRPSVVEYLCNIRSSVQQFKAVHLL